MSGRLKYVWCAFLIAIICLLVSSASRWPTRSRKCVDGCVGGAGAHEQRMHVAISATAHLAPKTYLLPFLGTTGPLSATFVDIALRGTVTEQRRPTRIALRDMSFVSKSPWIRKPHVLGYFVSDWDHTFSTLHCMHEFHTSRFARGHNTYTRLYRSATAQHDVASGWATSSSRFALAVSLTCMDVANPPFTTVLTSKTVGISSQAEIELFLESPLACTYQNLSH